MSFYLGLFISIHMIKAREECYAGRARMERLSVLDTGNGEKLSDGAIFERPDPQIMAVAKSREIRKMCMHIITEVRAAAEDGNTEKIPESWVIGYGS